MAAHTVDGRDMCLALSEVIMRGDPFRGFKRTLVVSRQKRGMCYSQDFWYKGTPSESSESWSFNYALKSREA